MKHKLTNKNIKKHVDTLLASFENKNISQSRKISFCYYIDLILNLFHKTNQGNCFQIKQTCKNDRLIIELSVEGKKWDLFSSTDPCGEEGLFNTLKQLMVTSKIGSIYKYHQDTNKYIFTTEYKPLSLFQCIKLNWKIIYKDRIWLCVGVSLQLINILISVALPAVSSQIVLSITNGGFDTLLMLGLILLCIYCVSSILGYIISQTYNKVYYAIKQNINKKMTLYVVDISQETFNNIGKGYFIQRLSIDSEKFALGLETIADKFLNICQYLGYIFCILFTNIYAFAFVFITIIIISMLDNIRTNTLKARKHRNQVQIQDYTDSVVEFISGITDIKLLNCKKMFTDRVIKKCQKFCDYGYDMITKNLKVLFFRNLLMSVFPFLFILLLLYGLTTESLGITVDSALLLFYYYSSLDTGFSIMISEFFEFIKEYTMSTERIYEIFTSDKLNKDKFGNTKLDKLTGKIEAKNINFSYNNTKRNNKGSGEDDKDDKSTNVLNNVSFDILPHQIIAFVGKSGSGKSTVISLMSKLYDIHDGDLLYDGKSINELTEQTIYNNIAIVTQRPHIFNMSIYDNITIANPKATYEEVVDVCGVACLNDDIQALPNKYRTIIGKQGIRLSGGQEQRIAIARALIKNPKILIMDESTSALDNKTQYKLMKNVRKFKKDITLIIVAHRLSTIKNADKIFVMRKGKIISAGKHEELMKNVLEYKGLYAVSDE